MKTILYNPIFINPQAYYVFPRLTRYLQPDNESTAEPANYIGTIEVKVIAYGDTTLKRTYTNTDSIDLSEFKNTWIRISLFTKVGSCVLGEWKIGNMESDLPYIDPEVLASLKAVVIVGNKTNNDSDRAIVKNLVDPDNPFVISNAAYTEGSGYADKDSPYYGAFVTDGIDDLITSTKTVQEMLGGSNEITVVSMAHFIKGESNAPEICRINQIRRDTRSIRNSISKIGKSGIFGYTYKNGVTTINNILGDKNDCTAEGNLDGIVAPFSVEGYYYNNNSNPLELCSIAWYWTIIANKVLITDQINQVIAYFNLDRTLKPDILCNVKKQGITNENHAEFTFNGVSIGYSRSITVDTAFNIGSIYNYDSPQEVNITIDEYIRYEDIVQPYPVLLRFNDENGNEVSWGGKFRVGSTITRIGSFYENNLIDGLYIVRNPKLNGNNLNTPTHVVEKSMVFTCDTEYLLDNNEPKCILSPSRLRMPNSSYKILGYIPDISGHGNHGKINNSAYAGMSGVNGYPVVFGANETWENLSSVYSYTSDVTSTTIHITRVKNAGTGLLFSYVKKDGALTNIREIPAFRVTVKGLEGNSKFGYRYLATEDATVETLVYLGNGTHELSKSFTPTEALLDLTRNAWVGIFITPMVEGEVVFDCDITIEVLPEYEGAYCLDGVDDFVTIPTTVGGKQVLMKVNWDSSNSALLYDQRGYNNEFAIYNGSADSDGNPIPAYQGRNNGQTYIDGILNSNIKASELRAITHNITITNELSAGVNKFSPVIGSNRVHNTYFTNMALYDFMLFDNISTDDKIKQLNEYVGIEGNTEWRKTK